MKRFFHFDVSHVNRESACGKYVGISAVAIAILMLAAAVNAGSPHGPRSNEATLAMEDPAIQAAMRTLDTGCLTCHGSQTPH